jgi:hypothetical protein
MQYRTGHIPDHPSVIKKRKGLHLASNYSEIMARAASLPLFTTNRAKLLPQFGGPGLTNQDDVGACEGFAHAEAGTLRLANQGKSKGLISPARLYLGALRFDSQVQADGSLSPITDTGTTSSSILNAWSTFGAELAANDPQYPTSSATMYKDPSDPQSELIVPAIDQMYADSPYRFNGAWYILSVGTQRVLDLLAALASGYTATIAIPASGSIFQGYTGGVLGSLSGPIDHAQHILDYEWTGSQNDFTSFVTALKQGATSQAATLALASSAGGVTPNFVLHNQNSWGTWGEGDAMSGAAYGLYRSNLNFFNQAEDACIIDISAV